MPRKSTRFELYRQAVAQLRKAVDALDQAHATLKDLKIDKAVEADTLHRFNARQLCRYMEGLLTDLNTLECEDCGHPLSKHGDKYGCEYDRGDIQMGCRDGGTVLAASGPCGCEWGLKVA